jgi:hypothetical protein
MKRSSQVALMLMGVTAVGASGMMLMPRRDCRPPTAAEIAAGAKPDDPCRSSGGSSSRGGSSGRSWFFGHGSGTGSSSSSEHGSSSSRGGFGSTGSAHASGGS